MTKPQTEILELRKQIKKMANVAMLWKDKSIQHFKIPSDQFATNGIKNVHQRLCSLADSTNTTVVNVIFEKDGYIPPHTHDRIERVYVLDGEYYDPVSKQVFSKGQVQSIPPNTLHACRSDYCLLTVTWQPAYTTEEILKKPEILDKTEEISEIC